MDIGLNLIGLYKLVLDNFLSKIAVYTPNNAKNTNK